MTNTTQFPDQEKQQKKRTALPYIRTVSEVTARLLRQHHIEIARKPSHKLATNFTQHKDPSAYRTDATPLISSPAATVTNNTSEKHRRRSKRD